MSTTRDLKAISYANYSEARDAKGLNNSQVAELAKIPSSTIYDWAASRYMPKTCPSLWRKPEERKCSRRRLTFCAGGWSLKIC